MVYTDAGKFKVLCKNLRYAETAKRNVLIHFESGEQVIYKSMKEIALLLETQRQFARCHASFIVNMAYVKSVENLEAVLTTGERVPVSQPKRKEFMAKLADFWGGYAMIVPYYFVDLIATVSQAMICWKGGGLNVDL